MSKRAPERPFLTLVGQLCLAILLTVAGFFLFMVWLIWTRPID